MKYFFLLFILVICGLVYVRFEQPKVWNDSLAALKAPEDSSPSSPISTPPVTAEPIAVAPTIPPPVTAEPIATASTNPEASTPTNAPSTNVVVNSPKVFIPPDPLPAQPNWTWTVLGRDYRNVVVTKVEADAVSITYDGGIGTVNTSDLTPDLQKMFNYDPELAAAASKQKAAALTQADAAEAPEIAAMDQARKAQEAADEVKAQSDSQANAAAQDKNTKASWYKSHIDAGEQDMITMEHPAVVGGSINWGMINQEKSQVYQLQQGLHNLTGEWYGAPIYPQSYYY